MPDAALRGARRSVDNTVAVADWLIPVSQYVRYRQQSGRTIRNRFDDLQPAALTGTLASVVCELRGSLVDVRAGDRMWLYTDELDAGVFGVGKAQKPTATNRATVTITVDKPRTRVLAADPLPAVTIRRWLPDLRQAAMLLDVRPRALGVVESWQQERAERDVELLGPLAVTPWRATLKPGVRTPVARDEVLAPIARLLRAQEFAIGTAPGNGEEPWLVGRRMKDVVVIDVEHIRAGRGRDEALAALGPLREFRWRIERQAAELRLQTTLWIAFTARPHDQVISFLEDEDVLVSWQQKYVTELTDRSKQRWYQYLGVR
jgi:hypothetical protein